ncbi:MAG TPA: TonB-dependent receptor [Saprospiraceae bacterium]|nr:TonB-dependent receptor [Saprospiraceae bacterium]HRV85040.1 TonB-dependent receptor [Saprospiraceae bacterium]
MRVKLDQSVKQASMFMAFFLLTAMAWTQKTITGTVTDAESGEPLIGANILVKGTSLGNVTDIDGTYSIQANTGDVLVFSYTGYENQEVTVGASNVIDVSLAVGKQLEEVVVIGYSSVKKSDLTGAVVPITEKDFNRGVITSPEELIQGRAAGVQITSASGEPGSGINIRIRGTSSVVNGNNPLFVVDGVPLSGDNTSASGRGIGTVAAKNPLNFLNPSDIVSIDILKDASATAIYGSRGANGVVIITTKSGQSGAGVLDYNVSFGLSTVAKRYDLLSPSEFIAAYSDFNGAAAAATLNGGAETDWQDELFRTAFTHNHNLSFGGGNDGGNYRFSLSYLNQEGVIQESGLQRLTGRFNGSKKFIKDKLNLTAQFTVSNNHDDNVPNTSDTGFEGDLIGNILKANPTQPVYNSDGTFKQVSNTEPNPLAMVKLTEGFANTLRTLGNVAGEFAITSDLSFKSVLGFDRSTSSRVDALSKDLNALQGIYNIGRLYSSDISIMNKLWENYFTYNKDFGSVSFNGLLGYSYQSFDYSGKSLELANFRTNDLNVMINNFGAAENSIVNNSYRTIDELQSYFGRVTFDIADKYLLTGTVRADGSTRFGPGNQYGYFPSFAFKWRLIQESFVPDFFTDLGVRLGWGLTGNQSIPHDQFQLRRRYGDWSLQTDGKGINTGGLGTISFQNPNLKWEATSQLNLGIDFGFANNRISGSLDLYKKNTKDLLIQVFSAQPAPQPFTWENLDADVVNQGIELALNTFIVDNADFSWNLGANIAYNHNIVKNYNGLLNTGAIRGQGLTGAFAERIAGDQPLYAFFLREFGGYDSEGITVYPQGDVQEFVGASPLPTINAGLTNSFTYKDFDLSFFFAGQFGHYVYNNTANAYFTAGSLANGRNVTKDVVGNGEGRLNAPDVSTRFLEKGDFVRLQNLSLGYNVRTSGDVFRSIRLFLTGQNLLLITKYSGQDPEVNNDASISGIPSLGIDYTTYPRPRTITFGANFSF